MLFLTHLHSDHTVGIPDLWLTGWLGGPFGHRTGAFRVRGPKGTKKMMNALRQAYSWDISTRMADEHLSPAAVDIDAEDVADGVVYDRNGVKVTTFPVDHGPLIRPSLGYRVDYGGHSVVLSGDTRPSESLVRHAAGADVLIHEVAMASPAMMKSEAAKRVIAHHTTPADAGRIFDRVKPRLAVYSHVVLLSMEREKTPPTVADVVEATRSTYKGPLEVGADLMKIEIGSEVRVTRP